MATPVDAARIATNIITAATSHAINVNSPSAGELLIVYVRFAGAAGTVTFTGYTQLALDTSDASDDENYLFYRRADGSEGATDTLTCTSSQKLAAICWRITGAANPATTPPSVSGVTIGLAANINPRSSASTVMDTTGALSSFLDVRGLGATNGAQAQSFLTQGTTLVGVSFDLSKSGTPTDNLVFDLYTDSSGLPGSFVGSIGSIAASSLTGAPTTYSLSCSLSVSNATTYWITVTRSGSLDNFNYGGVQIANGGSVYANGNHARNISGSWSNQADDCCCAIVMAGNTADYLFITVIGMDSETATATQPTGYSNLASANSGTGGAVATNCMIWGASKQTTAVTSDDPGAWTSSAPNAGVTALTIVIPPPGAVAPTVKRTRYVQPYTIAHRRAALR